MCCETAAQPEKQELEEKGENPHEEEFLSLRFLHILFRELNKVNAYWGDRVRLNVSCSK